MTSLGEYAKTYESKQTRNIAELEIIPTDLGIEDEEFETEEDGKTKKVKLKVAVLNGEKYRIPNSVFQQLRVILDDNPNLKRFKVKKSGEHMSTRYTVIPIFN